MIPIIWHGMKPEEISSNILKWFIIVNVSTLHWVVYPQISLSKWAISLNFVTTFWGELQVSRISPTESEDWIIFMVLPTQMCLVGIDSLDSRHNAVEFIRKISASLFLYCVRKLENGYEVFSEWLSRGLRYFKRVMEWSRHGGMAPIGTIGEQGGGRIHPSITLWNDQAGRPGTEEKTS